MNSDSDKLQTSYNNVANDYAAHYADELSNKPLDRALLGSFADDVDGRGRIAEFGCGPGQVGAYLHGLGVPVIGIDISDGMIAVARRLHPEMEFRQGSILDAGSEDEAFAGIVAFYSIIHVPRERLPEALLELCRVLKPESPMLISFHVGSELRHLEEWWGHDVSLDFQFYESVELIAALEASGFVVEMSLERKPYVPFEQNTRRGYILARKPGSEGDSVL